MASITLSVIGCIDYLAYGTIFTRAMFLPKKKLDVFFPARKAVDACREEGSIHNIMYMAPASLAINPAKTPVRNRARAHISQAKPSKLNNQPRREA
jgi:hypothetical protein